MTLPDHGVHSLVVDSTSTKSQHTAGPGVLVSGFTPLAPPLDLSLLWNASRVPTRSTHTCGSQPLDKSSAVTSLSVHCHLQHSVERPSWHSRSALPRYPWPHSPRLDLHCGPRAQQLHPGLASRSRLTSRSSLRAKLTGLTSACCASSQMLEFSIPSLELELCPPYPRAVSHAARDLRVALQVSWRSLSPAILSIWSSHPHYGLRDADPPSHLALAPLDPILASFSPPPFPAPVAPPCPGPRHPAAACKTMVHPRKGKSDLRIFRLTPSENNAPIFFSPRVVNLLRFRSKSTSRFHNNFRSRFS